MYLDGSLAAHWYLSMGEKVHIIGLKGVPNWAH